MKQIWAWVMSLHVKFDRIPEPKRFYAFMGLVIIGILLINSSNKITVIVGGIYMMLLAVTRWLHVSKNW